MNVNRFVRSLAIGIAVTLARVTVTSAGVPHDVMLAHSSQPIEPAVIQEDKAQPALPDSDQSSARSQTHARKPASLRLAQSYSGQLEISCYVRLHRQAAYMDLSSHPILKSLETCSATSGPKK